MTGSSTGRARLRAARAPPDRLRATGRRALPAPERRRQCGLRPARPGAAWPAHGRAAGGGRPEPGWAAGTRTSCPAASSSASRWPGRWRSGPRSSCWMSRSPPSMRTCAPASAPTCSGSAGRRAPRPSSSRTTRTRRCPWRTASPCSGTARSCSTRRRRTCTPGPPIPRWPDSSATRTCWTASWRSQARSADALDPRQAAARASCQRARRGVAARSPC